MKYFANIFNIFFLSGLQISLSPSQNPVSLFFRFFCVAILYVLFRFVQRNTERLVYAFIFTFRFELSTVEMKKRRGKKEQTNYYRGYYFSFVRSENRAISFNQLQNEWDAGTWMECFWRGTLVLTRIVAVLTSVCGVNVKKKLFFAYKLRNGNTQITFWLFMHRIRIILTGGPKYIDKQNNDFEWSSFF